MKTKKILFITNIPSPYRVNFFNEWGKRTDLTVLFEKESSDERDDSWKQYRFEHFRGIMMKGIRVSGNTKFCPEVCKYATQKWDAIIVADAATPTGMLAIQYMKLRHIPYWIEGDGAFAKSGRGLKEKIKKHFLSGANGYFSTSKSHDAYYLTYGAEKSKIHRYPFTSVSQSDLQKAYLLTEDDKAILRRKLCMKEDHIVLTVGRFSYRNGYGKGYDVLMRIAEKMGSSYGFFIVGDDPTEEFLRWKERERLDNIHFVGFKKKEQLAEYYAASDLFILLSRGEAWGLVINEAMANALPVITTDRCVAGLEMVRNDENGYIISVDNQNALVTAIKKLIDNSDLRKQFGLRSLQTAEAYTIEKMVKTHCNVLGIDYE